MVIFTYLDFVTSSEKNDKSAIFGPVEIASSRLVANSSLEHSNGRVLTLIDAVDLLYQIFDLSAFYKIHFVWGNTSIALEVGLQPECGPPTGSCGS